MNKRRVRVLTLVVTAQRNHFLTFAGFTVKNKTTSITPQTESVLLTGSSSTSVSASSSVFIFLMHVFLYLVLGLVIGT